jgi:hypothetical protein
LRLNGSDRRSFVYGEQEFRLRFRHEVIRAKRTGHTFSLGLVNVALSGGRDADLSYVPARRDLLRIAQAVRPTLLEGDVLACLEDGTLAALLPGVPAAEAEELLRGWKPTIGWILHQEKGEDFSAPNISTAVCECNGDGFVGPPEAERIAQMLTEGRPPGDIASRASAARVGRADSRK